MNMKRRSLPQIIHTLNSVYHVKVIKEKPFVILIHGILSTRTKDETTFSAQYRLLRLAGNPKKMARLGEKTIRNAIYPVGFYRTKARLVKRACSTLLSDFNGRVPSSKEELLKIPGVGPKVASLVLAYGFGIPSVAVDTHVNRISQRLGIVPVGNKPERTQDAIESLLSTKERILANHLLVTFGRDTCRPVSPRCYQCPIYRYCEYPRKKYYRDRSRSK